jgi:hypothetical protein
MPYSSISETNSLSIATADPHIRPWHFIEDHLNTHQSAPLVRYMAEESDLEVRLIRAKRLLLNHWLI